jgi:hypothetical protein
LIFEAQADGQSGWNLGIEREKARIAEEERVSVEKAKAKEREEAEKVSKNESDRKADRKKTFKIELDLEADRDKTGCF